MGSTTPRTWKSRDRQAQSPLCWCKVCGTELFYNPKVDSLCRRCRRERHRKQEARP